MTPAERDALIESVASAHRAIDPFTRMPRAHPAWHDLDDQARRIAYDRALATRELEAALSGETATARAVLARIR